MSWSSASSKVSSSPGLTGADVGTAGARRRASSTAAASTIATIGLVGKMIIGRPGSL